jgi:transposase-like protein
MLSYNQLKAFTDSLSTREYRELKEAIKKRDSVKHVSTYIESDIEDVKCPHCNSKRFIRWGKRNDMQRYKCKDCRKTFNCLTGTPLARLKKKGRWLEYSRCLLNGLSVRKAAAKCNVHFNTTFKWRHRFLVNANKVKPDKLAGIIEMNISTLRYSEKGKKKKSNLHMRKNIYTIYCKNRYNKTFDTTINNLSVNSIRSALHNLFTKDSLICSSSDSIYRLFTQKIGLRHGYIDISANEEVKKDIVHIKNTLGYQNNILIWMRRFRGVATKYLNNYLSWYRQLDEFNLKPNPKVILIRAKSADNPVTNPKLLQNRTNSPLTPNINQKSKVIFK